MPCWRELTPFGCVNLISVITAAGPGSETYLPDLAGSIDALRLPAGWRVSWAVVADGADIDANRARAALAADLGADNCIINHDRLWAGASRNRALAHIESDWVVTVDADDALLPEALEAWAQAAERDCTWCAFETLDWYPHEDRTTAYPPVFDEGPVTAGSWLDHFNRTGRHPAVPAAMLWPSELLMRAGGWAAAPSAEDAAPLLIATTMQDGWISHTPTYLYRSHAEQTTAGGPARPVHQASEDARALASRQAELWRR